MNKLTKCLSTAGAVCAVCAAASVALEYRKMKRCEEELASMPMYQLKNKFARVQNDEEKTVIELPRKMLLADKLRVCFGILTRKNQEDECCVESE